MDDLNRRIREFGEKSAQLLTAVSIALVVAATISTRPDLGVQEKAALGRAATWWLRAIFPILAGIVPLKEARWGSRQWYAALRWIKFGLLWVAVACVAMGLYQLFDGVWNIAITF